MLRILFIIFLTSMPALTLAAEKMAPPAFSWLSILNMLFGLAIVVSLIYGLSWVLKKYSRLPGSHQVDMKILGGVSLGTRERAVLIQVEGHKILLGVAPGRVNLLHQFDNKAFEQELATVMEQKP
jgi:flagellar protein FliO/FliZ